MVNGPVVLVLPTGANEDVLFTRLSSELGISKTRIKAAFATAQDGDGDSGTKLIKEGGTKTIFGARIVQ